MRRGKEISVGDYWPAHQCSAEDKLQRNNTRALDKKARQDHLMEMTMMIMLMIIVVVLMIVMLVS